MTATLDPNSMITAAAFAVGFTLLFIGLRGRRIGTEPRCRKCGYDLTGAASEHCSECGAALNKQSIIHGTRRRRPVMIAMSLLIVAAAGTFGGLDGYRQLQRVDKYRYYPFSWLIDGGHAGDMRALTELDRRLRADTLSDNQIQTLITEALAEQAIVPSAAQSVTQKWVNMLELLCQARKLSNVQQRKYLQQFYTHALAARPQVRAGEPIPYSIRETCSAPDTDMDLPDRWRPIAQEEWDWIIVALDDHNAAPIRPNRKGMRTRTTSFESRGVHGPNAGDSYISGLDLSPGRYRIEVELKEHIFDYITRDPDGDYEIDDFGPALYSRTMHLSATFEVLPADSPDSVSLIHDPSLAEQIRGALLFQPVRYFSNPPRIPEVSVSIRPAKWSPPTMLPFDFAFDAYIRIRDSEFPLSSVRMRAGKLGIYSASGSAPIDGVDAVDIILRSSPTAARNTVDMYEIWDGELVFEDIPVKRWSEP